MRTATAGGVRSVLLRAILGSVIAAGGAFGIVSPLFADPLGEATELFHDAEFESAVGILRAHVERGSSTASERVNALVLLARCQMRLGEQADAVRSLCRVLETDAAWQPDPLGFSSEELRTCRVALATCPRLVPTPDAPPREADPVKKWHQRSAWRIGMGVGVSALAYLLLSGGGDDGGPLPGDDGNVPGFPDPPQSSPASTEP